MDLILFLVFAVIAVVCAINVVVQTHPISSAISLVGVMGSLAVLYLLLGAEFLAAAQVIVYAGAIMVLFVFVIMLLNAGHEVPSQRSRVAKWLGPPLIAAFLAEMLVAIWAQFPPSSTASPAHLDGSPAAIGHLLFRSYVLPFEATSILILVAVLGAVVLAKKEF